MIDTFVALAMAATFALATLAVPADLSRSAAAITSPAEWVSADDYPPSAIRAKQQGTVGMIYRILPNGRVGACESDQSSGSDLLDAMACALVKARARYTPELTGQCRAVESASKSLRFTWVIPDESPTGPPPVSGVPFRMEVQVDVDAAGKVADCRTVTRTGPVSVPSGDMCLDVLENPDVPRSVTARGSP